MKCRVRLVGGRLTPLRGWPLCDSWHSGRACVLRRRARWAEVGERWGWELSVWGAGRVIEQGLIADHEAAAVGPMPVTGPEPENGREPVPGRELVLEPVLEPVLVQLGPEPEPVVVHETVVDRDGRGVNGNEFVGEAKHDAVAV